MISGGKPLRNLLRRWQDLSPSSKIPLFAVKVNGSDEDPKDSLLDPDRSSSDPIEVPKGYLAVYVGPEMRRFVIPASYLGVPAIRVLMERSAEEFGYEQRGGLRIPCEEEAFEEILKVLEKKIKNKKRIIKNLNLVS